MNARSTRILLIAALFLALTPVTTLAACLQSGTSCCCSGGCPEPSEARIERGSCCEMSSRTPAPATKPATVAPAPVKPLDDVAERHDVAETTVSVAKPVEEVRPTGRTSPVPLFTLHAALLI